MKNKRLSQQEASYFFIFEGEIIILPDITMNILLIGSGGREHAIAWKLSQSPRLSGLYIAPGNAGTSLHGKNIDLSPLNFPAVGDFCIENNIQMVVVGPEEPLVKGFRDYFLQKKELSHIPVIGPDSKGAMLEGSKNFAKEFMNKYAIPTARHFTVTKENIDQGISFLNSLASPYVLKADGLAAGKGVLILDDIKLAEEDLKIMLSGKFGEAGNKVVIEEFLQGIELSVFVLTDGINYLLLPEAKDYKRIGEGDTGPNTGGMGCISPVPFADEDFMQKVKARIIQPTINGLVAEKIHYQGFIFFGLINVNGNPFVIEYNCRMGDPETEVVFPRVKNDLLELFDSVANKSLDKIQIDADPRFASAIMLVSGGYPGDYKKGFPVKNLEKTDDCMLFHAGTAIRDNEVVTSGGRVMAVCCYGDTLDESIEKGCRNASIVEFEGKYFRGDIGFDLKNYIK